MSRASEGGGGEEGGQTLLHSFLGWHARSLITLCAMACGRMSGTCRKLERARLKALTRALLIASSTLVPRQATIQRIGMHISFYP